MTPPPGFLKGLQERCRKYGILLIMDEVSVWVGGEGGLGGFLMGLQERQHTDEVCVWGGGAEGCMMLLMLLRGRGSRGE